MADDSNPSGVNQEIDLDNIEVELLIICKNINVLNQAGAFLSRRGWPTTVVSDVGRGVELISEKKPDFILVSLSHPSHAIGRLPDLITQTFNLPCIGFIEASDATTTARFNQSRLRYKIQGQASGPTIYRTIRKILAERFQLDANERARDELSSVTADGGSDVMRFSHDGSPIETDGGVIIQKSSADATVGKGATIIRGEGADGDGDPILSSKPRTSLKAIEKKGSQNRTTGNMLFGQDLTKAPGPSEDLSPEELVGQVKQSLFGESGEDMTVVLKDSKKETSKKSNQSLLERAVEAAINRYCQTVPDVEPKKLDETTIVGVFPVESQSQPGYLVVVWQAPDMSAREEFLRGCEREIQSAFKVMNFDGMVGSGFWVQLPAVDFVSWTHSQAEFQFMSAHQKREVGVAFFPTTVHKKKPQPAPGDEGMFSVPLNEISTEQPVNFKAFIRLKDSGRYVLYLRNGRTLQPEQKERLQQNQVDSVYMKGVDLENHSQYVASNFLTDLILELKKVA